MSSEPDTIEIPPHRLQKVIEALSFATVDEFHLDTAPGRGTTVTCVFRGER